MICRASQNGWKTARFAGDLQLKTALQDAWRSDITVSILRLSKVSQLDLACVQEPHQDLHFRAAAGWASTPRKIKLQDDCSAFHRSFLWIRGIQPA